MQKFDLTNYKGLQKASEFLGLTSLNSFFTTTIVELGREAIKRIFATPEEMGSVVEKIIERGRAEGVDEMEIELNDKSGLNFNIPVEDAKIEVLAGKNQAIKLKVKYK